VEVNVVGLRIGHGPIIVSTEPLRVAAIVFGFFVLWRFKLGVPSGFWVFTNSERFASSRGANCG
jgi:hypothetical protein